MKPSLLNPNMNDPGFFSEAHFEPIALPLALALTLLSRRPARLSENVMRMLLEWPIHVTLRTQNTEIVRATVVIVTFNDLPFTRLCLASLLGNTDNPPYEVIV